MSRTYATNVISNKSSIGAKIFRSSLLAVAVYSTATYFALKNEAFHDTYTTYVPGGEQILDAIEDIIDSRQFQQYDDTLKSATNTAVTQFSSAKSVAIASKETLMDWYDYTRDVIAYLRGDTDINSDSQASAGPESGRSSRRKRARQGKGNLFDNLVNNDEPVPIQHLNKLDPALQKLNSAMLELVKVLNDSSLYGQAKRLMELSAKDITILDNEMKHLVNEQSGVLQVTDKLSKDMQGLEQDLEAHYNMVKDKVKGSTSRAELRMQERIEHLRSELDLSLETLHRSLEAHGEGALSEQRMQYLDELTKELHQRSDDICSLYTERVKNKVEQERGGRLGKINQVMSRQQDLERLANSDAEQLDESLKAHQIIVIIHALKHALSDLNGIEKTQYQAELQALLALSKVSSPFANQNERRINELVQASVTSISRVLENEDLASQSQLIKRFSNVSQRVRQASLIPEDGGNMFSYLVSAVMSKFMFSKQGLVEGEDIEARLARAEYYINIKQDIESAAREMNQLQGWPRRLAADWLNATIHYLEVRQALEVLQTQATLSSMLHTNQ